MATRTGDPHEYLQVCDSTRRHGTRTRSVLVLFPRVRLLLVNEPKIAAAMRKPILEHRAESDQKRTPSNGWKQFARGPTRRGVQQKQAAGEAIFQSGFTVAAPMSQAPAEHRDIDRQLIVSERRDFPVAVFLR